MKKLFLLAIILAAAVALAPAAAEAAPLPKVTICHIPPGNPANAHTITISENAWPAHQNNHGDLMGSCAENCEVICDDGLYCTIDVDASADECVCREEPRPMKACDDGVVCTTDMCDEDTDMCVNDPIPGCGPNACDPAAPDYDQCCEENPDNDGCEPECDPDIDPDCEVS